MRKILFLLVIGLILVEVSAAESGLIEVAEATAEVEVIAEVAGNFKAVFDAEDLVEVVVAGEIVISEEFVV